MGKTAGQGYDGADAREKPVEENEKIAVFSKPFLCPNNAVGAEKAVIFFNEEFPSQKAADPEKGHEPRQTAQCGGKINPHEIKPAGSHQKRAKSGDGIAGDGGENIFHKSTHAQQQIKKGIWKHIKQIKKAVQIRQGFPFKLSKKHQRVANKSLTAMLCADFMPLQGGMSTALAT